MRIDLEQFKFIVEDLVRETEESRAVVRREYEDRRRCVAIRADGQPCQAWAVWDGREQKCAAHLYRTRRKEGEVTDEIRRERRRRRGPVCPCAAYQFPHRRGRGLCRWPDEPSERWPTPAGSRQPGKPRRRRVKAIREKFGI